MQCSPNEDSTIPQSKIQLSSMCGAVPSPSRASSHPLQQLDKAAEQQHPQEPAEASKRPLALPRLEDDLRQLLDTFDAEDNLASPAVLPPPKRARSGEHEQEHKNMMEDVQDHLRRCSSEDLR